MKGFRWVWMAAVGLVLAGCGEPTLPGRQFAGERAVTSTAPPPDGAVPEKGVLEWGSPEAKVRVLAFYPVDDAHKELMDLLKGLAHEYQGKVYVRYVDYRTPEGAAIFQRAEGKGRALLINSQSSATIEAKPPYTVDFVQEMGRFWTAEELKKAIAQEVAKQYR